MPTVCHSNERAVWLATGFLNRFENPFLLDPIKERFDRLPDSRNNLDHQPLFPASYLSCWPEFHKPHFTTFL